MCIPSIFSQLGMGDPMAAHLGEARPGYLRDAKSHSGALCSENKR